MVPTSTDLDRISDDKLLCLLRERVQRLPEANQHLKNVDQTLTQDWAEALLVDATRTLNFIATCQDVLDESGRMALEVKHRVKARKSTISNLRAPINRLPVELFRSIIDLLVDSPPTLEDLHAFPPQLLHVCHLWRTISLSYPKLWSRITVSDRDYRSINHSESKSGVFSDFRVSRLEHPLDISCELEATSVMERLQMHLSLSGTSPLHVDALSMPCVQWSDRSWPKVSEKLQEVRRAYRLLADNIITPYASRIRSLCLQIEQSSECTDEIFPLPAALKDCDYLHIDIHPKASPTWTTTPTNFISDGLKFSPIAARFKLMGDYHIILDSINPIRLTHLKLLLKYVHKPSLNSLMKLLRHAKSLQHLDLNVATPSTRSFDSYELDTSLFLPSLSSLTVTKAAWQFLPLIQSPSNVLHLAVDDTLEGQPDTDAVQRNIIDDFIHGVDGLRALMIRRTNSRWQPEACIQLTKALAGKSQLRYLLMGVQDLWALCDCLGQNDLPSLAYLCLHECDSPVGYEGGNRPVIEPQVLEKLVQVMDWHLQDAQLLRRSLQIHLIIWGDLNLRSELLQRMRLKMDGEYADESIEKVLKAQFPDVLNVSGRRRAMWRRLDDSMSFLEFSGEIERGWTLEGLNPRIAAVDVQG